MLTTADFAGVALVHVRALVNVVLDDGRRLHTGEVVDVSPEEAQRLAQRAAAAFEALPVKEPRSCSARRGDDLWMAGVP